MLPANPPLPASWNLPVQLEEGSQTSASICESLDGLSTRVTRQNSGRLGSGGPAGGVNAPAGVRLAPEIVVSGSESLARSSQLAVNAGPAAAQIERQRMAERIEIIVSQACAV